MFTADMLERQENKISLLDAVQCQTKGLWHRPKRGGGRELLLWAGAGPRACWCVRVWCAPSNVSACDGWVHNGVDVSRPA